jgi:hypothetical protein
LNRTDIVRAVSNHESLPISLCEKVICACPEWEPRSPFVTHLVDVVVANA